jgi:hypothetical protein
MSTALWLLVYFLPAIIGFYRKHHKAWGIFALNLLLGWTVLGWIAAMVWAAMPESVLTNRRDRQAMLTMRATMVNIQALLFPENQKTGAIVRMKTGLHLTQHLESCSGLQLLRRLCSWRKPSAGTSCRAQSALVLSSEVGY